MSIKPRWYQDAAVNSIINYISQTRGDPCVVLPTGCHAKGTLIKMLDGTVKAVEEIRVGDEVLGNDATKRTVERLYSGQQKSYRISPDNGGPPFVVNADHILYLFDPETGYYGEFRAESIYKNLGIFPGLALSYGVPNRRVQLRDKDLPSSELMGLLMRMLDDCGVDSVNIHVTDRGFTSALKKGAAHKVDILDYWPVDDPVAIPPEYRHRGGLSAKLFLRGLFDGAEVWATRNQSLANSVMNELSSVGLDFFSFVGQTDIIYIHLCKSRVSDQIDWDVADSGTGAPTKFRIEPVGVQGYFGFGIDGNQLYQTGDSIIHHNSGKSLVMGSLVKTVVENWGARVIVAAHVKELIEQNMLATANYWPEAPMGTLGVYSAGLGKKDTQAQVTFAGIQSVYRHSISIGKIDLIIVDEAHRIPVSGEGRYRQFISEVKQVNPHARVIGLTATPFRLKGGAIAGDGKIFSDIAFEVGVKQLIDEGYLSPLVNNGASEFIAKDLANHLNAVSSSSDDYTEDQLRAVYNTKLFESAIMEIIAKGKAADRKSWVLFCSTVDLAVQAQEILNREGIPCGTVSADTPAPERDRELRAFKDGRIRAITNVNILSEGFDAPGVDLVAMLRPTKSAGLMYQQIGRGFRFPPDKDYCLVLDYARNLDTHGPVDKLGENIKEPAQKKQGLRAAVPPAIKACPECDARVPANTVTCECGYFWPPNITAQASSSAVISGGNKPDWDVRVTDAYYNFNAPKEAGKLPTMRVEYYNGLECVAKEWVCLEHEGYARDKATGWWMVRTGWDAFDVPADVEVAIQFIEDNPGVVKMPTRLTLEKDGQWDRVKLAHFDPIDESLDPVWTADVASAVEIPVDDFDIPF